MADPNDDLLEDGDLADGHYELDLADEDALLADDYDEKPMKSLRTTDPRNHPNIEDEDFIEIGVEEDLALVDESKNEGENTKHTRKTIVFDDSNNDDSDDGGKERTRFKTERNINAVPRPTSSIPETLDAVAVKPQPNVSGYNNRGRGGIMAKRGFRGGPRGGFLPRGIGMPRFRGPHPSQHQFGPPMPPMQHIIQQHKQQSMDMGQIQQQPYHHFPHVVMGQQQYNIPPEDHYQQSPPVAPAQPPGYHHNTPPVVQPPAGTNIHVNPHFRGPRPQVNQNLAMWNGSGSFSQGNQNIQQNYHQTNQQPPYHQNQYQPPSETQQWTENTNVNEYYHNQQRNAPSAQSTQQNNYDDQYYNGVQSTGGVDQHHQHAQQQYYHQQPQHTQQPHNTPHQSNFQQAGGSHVGPNVTSNQMNWNDNNYYSGQQAHHPVPPSPGAGAHHPNQQMFNMQHQIRKHPIAPPQMNHQNTYNNRLQQQQHHQQQMQIQHKNSYLLNKKNLFKTNKFQSKIVVNKGRGGKVQVMHMNKKEQIIQNKITPTKPARLETGALRQIQITNLHEVTVSTNISPQKKIIPEPMEEEDEEMKAYRKKIEEQKKLREQVLKQKEEKRKVAAQQKFQMLAARKKNAEEQTAAVNTTVQNAATNLANQQFKIVRVRLQDGRTVVKKLSAAQISKLKKISSGTKPPTTPQTGQVKSEAQPKSRIVVVDNLSASTTQKQLENMAKLVGKVERVRLNAETKRATVIFESTTSAAAFIQKFQRKMVDLSMISLRMLMNADDINVATTTTTTTATSGSVLTTNLQTGNGNTDGSGGIVSNVNTVGITTSVSGNNVKTTIGKLQHAPPIVSVPSSTSTLAKHPQQLSSSSTKPINI